MSQPPAYSRAFSFTNFQAANPTQALPGTWVDIELNNAKATLDATLANLALIQRDDGAVKNASIGFDQLKAEVPIGFNVPQVWATGTAYTANSSTVFNGSGFYRCLTTHTSTVFATDLAAVKWQLIVNLAAVPLVNASQIAVTPSGVLTTDAQGSLQALDAGKAATSHTHPASAISDSTAAGRAMLVAANVFAQQTLLGLGSLAFLNSLNVTQIAANLAFINPATGSLLGSVNNWSPTGWATSAVVRLSSTGAINVTGMAATTDGDIKIIHNTSAFTISFLFESASSAAGNRIAGPTLPNLFQLLPGNSIAFMYDNASSRWRVLSPVGGVPASTNQVFTSASGTYITPANCRRIRIRLVGGGGGGGGGNNSTPSTAGGASTFFAGALTAGGGGTASGVAGPSTGGTATGGNIANIGGGSGGGASGVASSPGGMGGSSYLGGAGAGAAGNQAGSAAATNSGSGGGGGGGNATTAVAGGGGSGGYVEHVITNPAATYTYAVGAGGAGAAGTSAGNGGAGAAGIVIIDEDY